MGPVVSKQDVQNIINTCQNRILERTASKQDLQAVNDTIKSLLNLNQQSQQLMRQAEYQRSQMARRVMALEARLIQLEQELRVHRDMLSRISNQQSQPQQIIIPAQSREAAAQGGGQLEQYVYRPA